MPTFSPSESFAFVRSYIAGFQISISPGWRIEDTGNPIVARIDLPTYTARIAYHVRSEFWAWSSNAYTLGWVLERVNYYDTLGNANDVDAYNLGYGSDSLKRCYYLHCTVAGGSGLLQVNLPPSPTGYWLAQPPCSEILS